MDWALAGHEVKTSLESEKLFLYALVEEEISIEVDIFSLVGLVDQDVRPALLQILSDGAPDINSQLTGNMKCKLTRRDLCMKS